jgi:hypothetical protein
VVPIEEATMATALVVVAVMTMEMVAAMEVIISRTIAPKLNVPPANGVARRVTPSCAAPSGSMRASLDLWRIDQPR